MTELNEKSLNTLEYRKITEQLAAHAVCEDAKELARGLMPVTSLTEVMLRLTETEDAVKLAGKKGSPGFAEIRSVDTALKRADKGAALSLRELLDVAYILKTTRRLQEYMDDNMNGLSIKELFSGLEADRFVEGKIDSAIISEEEVSDNASPALASIRRKISRSLENAREVLQRLIRSQQNHKYLQEPIITMRGDRYVVPVKSEYRSEIPGLVHDTSGSGSTLFVEPMPVVEANNELRMLRAEEQKEIERILFELSSDVSNITEKIRKDYTIIVRLDFIFSKAKYAYAIKATRPIMNDKGIIDLRRSRHPLIDPAKVVPTNISLGGDYTTLVITGPNTGGKTVTLKTIGLLTLMAEAGLFVPCADESRLSVFDNVFCDIGDEQSIEQSLSTFSSHMTNIVKIINEVDRDSLVLFDELGAGTDPVEGATLAISILERVKAFGAKTAATTHYAELKVYALKTPGVENASCEFDVETLKPTYKLLIGIPGKSNAFAISSKLGLDDDIISRARSLIGSESLRFEEVLSDLEAKRQAMEKQRDEAEHMKTEIARMKSEIEEQRKKFDLSREKEIEKARNEAKRVLASSKRFYENMVSELEDIRRQKEKEDFESRLNSAKKSLKAGIKQLDDTIDPVENKEDDYKLPRALRVGDVVRFKKLNKEADVLTLPDDKGDITVRAGLIKTKVNISDVVLVEKERVTVNGAGMKSLRSTSSKIDRDVTLELDLRGKMVDESEIEIDSFLDGAVMNGLSTVTIIHGKGTGALRAGVHSYLKGHPHVRSFRLGVYGEGESGVTIVELK
ncbi:MAG: endonuclease MutS2 [Bacillota bacterium]|nr:endonuclease MutS2 [Bacillota bacterium]